MSTVSFGSAAPRWTPSQADSFAETLVLDDFDRIAECFPRHECRFMQLGRGPFRAELRLVLVPGIRCLWGRLNRPIRGVRVPPGPRLTFSPVNACNSGWRKQGRHFRPGVVQYTAGTTPREDVTTVDSECSGITVEEPILRDAVAVLLRRELDDLAPASRMSLSPSAEDFDAFGECLMRVINAAVEGTDPTPQPETARRLRARMLTLICDLLDRCDLAPDPPDRGGIREAVVRESLDYMHAHFARPLTSLDLCRELLVSRRTLFYAFQDAFGFGPMTYLKRLRMNKVRAELLAGDPSTATVREFSARMGFRHPGQFAADYARLFGELPHATLARVR